MPLKFGIAVHIAAAGVAAAANIAVTGAIAVEVRAVTIDRLPQRSAPKGGQRKTRHVGGLFVPSGFQQAREKILAAVCEPIGGANAKLELVVGAPVLDQRALSPVAG